MYSILCSLTATHGRQSWGNNAKKGQPRSRGRFCLKPLTPGDLSIPSNVSIKGLSMETEAAQGIANDSC